MGGGSSSFRVAGVAGTAATDIASAARDDGADGASAFDGEAAAIDEVSID
jgi:hypothetical protein